MVILKTKNYKKNILSLTKKDRVLLAEQEKTLGENIFHPKLHTKKLKGFPDEHIYSFRITRSYRGIFRLANGDNVILFAIGHRKDIYQSL
jgi:mRNA-degrading endonuclease RelE of RelBE toxin-antitoxin system